MSFKSRSPLMAGGYIVAILAALLVGVLCCSSKDTSHNTKSQDNEVDRWISATTCTMTYSTSTTSTCTTTITTSTVASTTTTVVTSSTTQSTTATTQSTTVASSTTTAVATAASVIQTQPASTEVVQQPAAYSEADAVLLAKLINHEASASYSGKLAVGSCVINRANRSGATISQVIFAPGQFTTASSLTTYTTADYNAAVQVLTQGSTDARIYFFDGCHPDHLNHFFDYYHNFLYAA